MWLLLAFVPPLVFLASLISLAKWRFSVGRTLFILLGSLAVAATGMVLGVGYWNEADTSGDASAVVAGAFFGILVTGPIAGTLFFWAAVAISKAFRRGR